MITRIYKMCIYSFILDVTEALSGQFTQLRSRLTDSDLLLSVSIFTFSIYSPPIAMPEASIRQKYDALQCERSDIFRTINFPYLIIRCL